MEGKQAKGQAVFRRHHSTTDHLATLRITAEECRNNKADLFCCLVDFIKAFDTVPGNNPWNRLEEIKVPFELRVVMLKLYENVISKFKNNEGWKNNINCDIGFKQGFSLSPTFFGIYIDKLKKCLEEADCISTISSSSSYFMLMILFLWQGVFLISISN